MPSSSSNLRNKDIRHRRLLLLGSFFWFACSTFARNRTPLKISLGLKLTQPATVRKHLKGETKAGQIIKQSYEKLKNEGFIVTIPGCEQSQQVKSLEDQLKNLQEKVSKAKDLLNQVLQTLG